MTASPPVVETSFIACIAAKRIPPSSAIASAITQLAMNVTISAVELTIPKTDASSFRRNAASSWWQTRSSSTAAAIMPSSSARLASERAFLDNDAPRMNVSIRLDVSDATTPTMRPTTTTEAHQAGEASIKLISCKIALLS